MAANIRAGRAFVEMALTGTQKFRAGLVDASRSLKRFGRSADQIGKSMTRFGLAGVAAGGLAVKVFSDFDDQMRMVKAITGANVSEFRLLTDEAKRLGSTTRFSASEAAEGMKFLGMAGFSTQEILAGIPAVLNLAAAGAVDLGLAADIVSDVGSAFGLAANEVSRVSDVIAQTASSANTSVELMGETFKYVAPIAKSAGQDIEEMSAAIGILGNSGIKASSAGTQLTEVLAAMAADGAPKLQKLGVAVKNADGTSRDLLDVMRDLGQATRNLSPMDRLNVMMNIFGKRGGRAAIVMADAGDAVDDMREKMDAASGRAEEMAKTMEGGIGGAFRELKSAVEGAAISVGEALAPFVRRIADIGKVVAVFVTNNKQLAVAGVAASVALVGIGGAFTALGIAASGASAAMGVAATVIGVITSPVGMVVAAIATLVASFAHVSGAGGKAAKWLGDRFEELRDRVGPVFDSIRDAMDAQQMGLAARIMWTAIQLEFHRGIESITTMLEDAKNKWLKSLTTIPGLFKSATLPTRLTPSSLVKSMMNAGVNAGRSRQGKDAVEATKDTTTAVERLTNELKQLQMQAEKAKQEFEKGKQEAAGAALGSLGAGPGIGPFDENPFGSDSEQAAQKALGTFSPVMARLLSKQTDEEVEQLKKIAKATKSLDKKAKAGGALKFA